MTDAPATGRLRFRSFGVTMELLCRDADLFAQAVEALPPAWAPAAEDGQPAVYFEIARDARGPRRPVVLRVDGVVTASALRVATVVDELEVAIRSEVATRCPAMLFVHAGVVAVDGIAVVIPGASGSGKTTLVEALLKAGARYGSDDYAVLDAAGRVHPYPRRLSIRQGPHRRMRASAEDVAGAGAGAMREPLPLGLVVVTTFEPAATWRPTPLTPGQAAIALLGHTLAARDRPAEALRILANATDRAVALAGPRGDAPDSAPRILAAARAASPPALETPE